MALGTDEGGNWLAGSEEPWPYSPEGEHGARGAGRPGASDHATEELEAAEGPPGRWFEDSDQVFSHQSCPEAHQGPDQPRPDQSCHPHQVPGTQEGVSCAEGGGSTAPLDAPSADGASAGEEGSAAEGSAGSSTWGTSSADSRTTSKRGVDVWFQRVRALLCLREETCPAT